MRNIYFLKVLTFVALLVTGVTQQAFAADDLQEHLDRLSATKTRSGSEPTIIDLSKFGSTVRETTLEVTNGLYVRFVNGTLSRTSALKGPIAKISGGAIVEWGENAVCNDAGVRNGNSLVAVEDASLVIDGGNIELSYSNKTAARLIILPGKDDAVLMSNDKSVFKINSGLVEGKVLCNSEKAYMSAFNGGVIESIVSKAPVEVWGSVKIKSISCSSYVAYWSEDASIDNISLKSESSSYLMLCKHLKKDIYVSKGYIMSRPPGGGLSVSNASYWYVRNGDVVAVATEHAYDGLTAEDMSHIKDPYDGEGYIQHDNGNWGKEYEYTLQNDGREVVIKPKSNGITTADDLQKKLDEIAASGQYTVSNPCVIELTDYIKIDKKITVPQNCHAVITGGKLIVVGDQINDTNAFVVYGSLKLKDMTFDCCGNNNISLKDYFYVKGGSLFIDENVEFTNIHSESNIGLCSLVSGGYCTYKSGVFTSKGTVIEGNGYDGTVYIQGGTIESSGIAINKVVGAYIQGNATIIGGDVVIDCKYFTLSEGSTVKSANSNSILVKLTASDGISGGNFVGDNAMIYVREFLYGYWNVEYPTIYLDAKAQYNCGGTLSDDVQALLDKLNDPSVTDEEKKKILIFIYYHYKRVIDGEWANYPLNTDIVTGICSRDMFDKLFTFKNMPDDLEMYYNEKNKSAQLRRKNRNNDDLQDFLNSLGDNKGTEENPVEVPFDDNFDMNGDVNFDDLQAFLDGLKDDGSNKTFAFNGGNLNINPGSTVTIRNIDFVTKGNGGCINVSGTLIIDININIVKIIQFIHVLDGGRVVWRDGSGNATEIVINITGGNVEYWNGNYTGGHHGFCNHGGTIYIYNGTIGGGWSGGYTYSGGHTYISGGTVVGGYINWGYTKFTGGIISGTVSTGDGSGVWHVENGKGGTFIVSGGLVGGENTGGAVGTGGDLYLDNGTHGVSDIYVLRDGKIYINFSLTVILRIHISITEIVLNTPIIVGYDGYRLTESDLKKIEIILPDGYKWQFDSITGAIIIVEATGINDVVGNDDAMEASFGVNGQKQQSLQKGLNIIRRKDGTVRKVMVK